MNRGKITFLLVIIFFFLASRVDALTYLGVSHLGDPISGIGARSLGMGGTSIACATDSSSLFVNPSCLGILEKKELSLALGIAPVVEKVVTEDELTYFNSQCYFQLNSGVVAVPVGRKFNLALGLAPLYDNHYQHEKSIFDSGSPGEKIGSASINGKGNLYTYSLGGAWKPMPYLCIGGAISLLNGESSLKSSSTIYASPPATITELKSNLSGFNFTLGGILYFTDEFRAGFVVKTGGKIHDRWKADYPAFTEEGKTELKFPLSYGLGVAYTFFDEISSTIAAELIFSEWSGFKSGTNYRDTFEFRIGAEHYLTNVLYLRYGFYFQPFYGSKEFQMVSFTGGLGYKFNDTLSFDFAGEFGKRNYYGDAAFFEERQRIDETVMRILIAIRFQH
ncbi:MAG: OmpP1/FadL family transporter [Candidatus Lokiarchaeia archaeon]